MKKNKPLVKDKEKIIIQYIDSKGGAVTPNEIAEKTGISYVTVKKYLDKLVREGILIIEDDQKKQN